MSKVKIQKQENKNSNKREKTRMRKLITICAAMSALILAVLSPAMATTVALVPSMLNVTPGSNVGISVYMTVNDPGITMAAISTNILYDKNVFAFDDASVVTQGALLTHSWDLWGAQTDMLRVGGIDLSFGEDIAAGSGMLLTFTLKVKDDAPTGLSSLAWGMYDGFDNATAGFDYGDAEGVDIILLDSEMSGASINVTPEPATIGLLGLGALSFIRRKK
jgi:hypothetical protein